MILLRVPGTLEYRNLALRAVSEACRIAQHDEWEGASLEAQTVSALGEAFNNIAIHSYAGRPPGDVTVEISWTRDEIVMQITDEGLSFDPELVELPDLDALPEGGMGLFIIRSFMDEVDYQAGPPNVLRLVKRRTTRAEGEMAPMSRRSNPLAGSGTRGSSSGGSGSTARGPAGPDRGSESARSGWRLVAVDGGAATSLRKTGSAGQK
ncbi:MAG: ATP-binding protein [Byssovorax sp.]